jgi:hypothetical protein
MSTGRRVWAGLQLLDRQLLARGDEPAGCIDDIELSASDDGENLYATAILSGPGALAYRFGARRFGRWLRRVGADVAAVESDPTRIPFNLVTEIGSHVGVALDADEVGTASGERWTRDHVIEHIPGSGHAPE